MTDFEFMTFAEAADRLAITADSVRRQARRRKWPRRKTNSGQSQIGVPLVRLTPDNSDSRGEDSPKDSPPDNLQIKMAALDAEVAGLRDLVQSERRRADAAEQDRDAWRDMAQRPWWKRLAG